MKQGEGGEIFAGVHFRLVGFEDPIQQSQIRSKLVNGGGVDGGGCTHLIVHKDKIVYNDSECAVARAGGKTVVTALWVEHCIDVGMLVDATSILYRPVKDLNGIPGAKALSICLTGYQRQDREDIMKMVTLMGAHFSKPLVANKVTHLICYKFEGEKYELAKKLKKIKLLNHCWLEDCLRAWEILPEGNYNKSGYELEIMEAEAKDSEEETEETKCTRTLGQNIGDTISKSHMHGGRDARISKEPEISVPIDQNEVGQKILPGEVDGNINDNRSVSNPRSGNTQGGEYTCQDIGANVCKQRCESYFNHVTAAKTTHYSDAATPVVPNYSRKPLALSPVSKLSGMLSNHLHGSPHADSKQLKVKVSFEATQQLDQIKFNANSRNNHDSELHDEAGGSLRLPLKRKSSLSSVTSKSPCKEATYLKDCATGSPSTSAAPEEFITGRLQVRSGSLNGHDGSYLEKYDVQRPASNQSSSRSKTMHLRNDNGTLNHELPSSRTSLSGGTEFPSSLEQSDRPPEPSLLGFEQSKFRTEPNIDENEMCNLTNFQVDKKAESVEEFQITMVPSLNSGIAGTDEPKKSVDLGVHNGGTNDTCSRSLSKRIVAKKGFGSKSKSGSGSNKQNRALCLKTKNTSEEVTLSTEVGKEATYGSNTGVIAGMAEPPCKADILIEKKVTGNLVCRNKGENAAASEDDETEAPDEEFGAKLEDTARAESTISDLPANVAEVACSTFTSDAALKEDATVIMEKDGLEVVEGEIFENVEVGGSGRKDKLVKERNKAVKRIKKPSVNLVKKKDTCGGEKAVGPEKINEEEKKVEVKKENRKQDPAKNQKNNTVLLDKEEKSMIDEETIEVKKKNRKQDPAKKQKSNIVSLDKEEKSMNEAEDDKPTENIHLVQGKHIEGQKILLTDGAAILKIDEHEVVARDKSRSGVAGGSNRKEEMAKGRTKVSSKIKKPSLSVVNGLDMSTKTKEMAPAKINDEEMMEVKKAKVKQCSSSKQKSKPLCLKKADISLDEMEEDKKQDIVKGTNDGNLESEIAKDVHRLVSNSKSRTSSLKKAQKHMEEDKEKKPSETGILGAKSGKHKRDTVETELNAGKANADGMPLGGGLRCERLEPVLFIVSGHRVQRKEFQQIIRRLKGKVCRDSHCWSYQATHLILPDPIRRTEKFFAAAASGRWILRSDYLATSNQAGKLLAEEPYEWFNSGFSEDGAINLEAPRKWRLLRERTGHGAFYGMRIIIYGECIAPSLDTLKRVVKAGDGLILATSPPYTRFVGAGGVDFAVVSPGMSCGELWVQEFLRHEIPCVVADYLVEYVCKTGCSLEKHVLYNTHGWAEKSLAKLVRRSEEMVENDCTAAAGEDDISCQVCKSCDRAEVMLICGDERGSFGCGVGAHIDCCDPPLEAVPEEDWFCPKCSDARHPKKKKKGSSSSSSSRRPN